MRRGITAIIFIAFVLFGTAANFKLKAPGIIGVTSHVIKYAASTVTATNQAFQFAGDGCVSIPVMSVTTNITVTAWINPNTFTPASIQHFLAWHGGGCGYAGGLMAIADAWSGNMAYQIRTSGDACDTSFPTPPATGWVHVAFSVGPSKMISYVAGLPVLTNDATVQNNNPTFELPAKIGNATDLANPYAGRIDDIRFYTQELSKAEVYTVSTTKLQVVGVDRALYAWYRCPVGTVTNSQWILDISGNGHNGTATNVVSVESPLN